MESNVSYRYNPEIDEISFIIVALLFSLMRWSVRYRQKKGTWERFRETKFITLKGPREVESLNVATEPWEKCQGNRLNQAGGEPRNRIMTCRQMTLLGLRVEYTSKRHKGISLVHLNLTRSHSGEGWKGEWWQVSALSHWYTWSPEWWAHSLFVKTLRQQENTN